MKIKTTTSYLIFCTIFILFLFINISYSISKYTFIKNLDIDSSGPILTDISPKKYEQYIISKPTIKINYSDESGIDKSSIKLSINYKDVTKDCKISDSYIEYKFDKKLRKGNQIVKIELNDLSSSKNKSVFEWYFTVGVPVYNHYYGLLHAHTSASDGHGTYNDAYYFARDKAKLDFFAITEHSQSLDNQDKCFIDNALGSSEWTSLDECKNWFSVDESFIPLRGFEMTYPRKETPSIGHINIFNSKGFVSSKDKNLTLDKFYKLISEQDNLIGQFNHPGEKFGNFDNLKYSKDADKFISLIEVCNGYNLDLSKNIHSYDMYQLALDNGWHVAPTANQDNHRVDFGLSNEYRTVILSTGLTEQSLYDSLSKMRVYATQDKNIKIDYFINDLPMGSFIDNGSKINFYISAIDNDEDDKIQKIEVISNNGKLINSKNFNSNLAKLEFSLKNINNKFYYVKVIQNNKISVTAPIWVK